MSVDCCPLTDALVTLTKCPTGQWLIEYPIDLLVVTLLVKCIPHRARIISLREREAVNRIPGRDGHVLPPLNGKAHGRGGHVAACLISPQRLTRFRIERDEIPFT